MAFPVVSGASIVCTFGTAPSTLMVTSQLTVTFDKKPAATIQDAVPMSNIAPCGLCNSLANPATASATAAAMGVLTPQPCVPATTGAWVCANTMSIAKIPSLTNDGTLMCAYGGTISVTNPQQTKIIKK